MKYHGIIRPSFYHQLRAFQKFNRLLRRHNRRTLKFREWRAMLCGESVRSAPALFLTSTSSR